MSMRKLRWLTVLLGMCALYHGAAADDSLTGVLALKGEPAGTKIHVECDSFARDTELPGGNGTVRLNVPVGECRIETVGLPTSFQTSASIAANQESHRVMCVDDWALGRYFTPADPGWRDQSGDRFREQGDGTVKDTLHGLVWIKAAPKTRFKYREAVAYCKQLAVGRKDDWRVPTISEARSFIVGCPDTELDGACSVHDDADGYGGEECSGCSGCGPYWDRQSFGGPNGWYWTRTAADGVGLWTVYYNYGGAIEPIAPEDWEVDVGGYVRCVRGRLATTKK